VRRITLSIALLLLVLLTAWVVGFLSRTGRIGASLPSASDLRANFEAEESSP
jgi:hypothetical protein